MREWSRGRGGWAWGVIGTAFTFGLRHGADWDHIAAISDITGTLKDRKRSMVLALVYALGHTLVILILGLLAVFFGEFIPDSVATVMTPIVGGTLLRSVSISSTPWPGRDGTSAIAAVWRWSIRD